MNTKKTANHRVQKIVLWLLVFVLLAAGGFLAYRFVIRDGLGLRGGLKSAAGYVRAVAASQSVKKHSTGQYTNTIFLHHSVGNNLIEQGHLRELLNERGFVFWDQGYNNPGLRGPDGTFTGYAYSVPGDNTDIDGLAVIFRQTPRSLPVNTLSGLLQYEVILIKSCFPNNNIGSAEKLEALKEMYREMRATMDAHPEKIFILLTTPPLNPVETNSENARRAREISSWLASDDFIGDRRNLFVFNFFDLLAEAEGSGAEANMLKAEYREGSDSHPNQRANQTIAPALADFVAAAVEQYVND